MLQHSSPWSWWPLLAIAALCCPFHHSYAFQAVISIDPSNLHESTRRLDSLHRHEHAPFSLASTSSNNGSNESDNFAPTTIYFDISIQDTTIGRLLFHLTPSSHPNYLPIHISNLLSLVSSSRVGLDPKATYKRCTFQYSPSSIEDGSMRYRWGHVCDGPNVKIKEQDVSDANQSLMNSKQSCFGGAYYGMSYGEVLQLIRDSSDENENEATLLTVPTTLSTKFSIVRVSESPREWGERLLLNSAVIGYLDCDSLDVLRLMARQRVGVPKIVDCGVF